MRADLERYREDELALLHQFLSDYFAQRHQEAARHFDITRNRVGDLHLDLFLKAVAALTARVRLRFDDSWSQLFESLLAADSPHLCSPLPAMTVLEVRQAVQSPTPGTVRRGQAFQSDDLVDGRRPQLRACQDVTVWPVKLDVGWQNVPAGLASSSPLARGIGAAGALCFRFTPRSPHDGVQVGRLAGFGGARVYLAGGPQRALPLFEALFGNAGVWCRAEGKGEFLPAGIKPVGFGAAETVVPFASRTYRGEALLADFLAFPEKHAFADLVWPAPAREASSSALEVVVLLRPEGAQAVGQLAQSLGPSWAEQSFRLNCTPAVNLFSSRVSVRLAEGLAQRDHIALKAGAGTAIHSIRGMAVQHEGKAWDVPELFEHRPGALDGPPFRWMAARPLVGAFGGGGEAAEGRPSGLALGLFNPTRARLPDQADVELLCVDAPVVDRLPDTTGWSTPDGNWKASQRGRRAPTRWPPRGENDRRRAAAHLAARAGRGEQSDPAGGLRRLLEEAGFGGWQADHLVRQQEQQAADLLPYLLAALREVKQAPAWEWLDGGLARGREIEITLDAAQLPGGACLLPATVLGHYLRLAAPLGAFYRVAFRTGVEGPAWRLPTATEASS